MDHRSALILSSFPESVVPESVYQEVVAEESVDVDDHNTQEGGEQQLVRVVGDGLDHVLQSVKSVLPVRLFGWRKLTMISNRQNP